jgi:hypothetical protein
MKLTQYHLPPPHTHNYPDGQRHFYGDCLYSVMDLKGDSHNDLRRG